MSPRKWYLTVEEWPPLKIKKIYRVMVEDIVDNKEKSCLNVTVENLDPSQLGRRHEFSLPSHIYPGNGLSRFLNACGLDARHPKTQVCMNDALNAVIGIRFEKAEEAEDYVPVVFEHIPQPDIGDAENGPTTDTRS